MRLLRHSRGNPETNYVEAYLTAPPLDSTRKPAEGEAGSPPGTIRPSGSCCSCC